MAKFELTYFTRRWGTNVTLKFEKKPEGWYISHMAINGETGPDGAPILESNLRQDNVHYPVGLDGFLGFLWGELHHEQITEGRAQEMFEELGKWITTVEKSQPTWVPWNSTAHR